MAERRMFSKTIIDSDAFVDMSIGARLLYYDLGMRADDDGFVNSPKKIMKFIGVNNNDLNELISKKFVISFNSGVIVIKHWKIHNYIRKDTYNETNYKEEKKLLELDENKAYRLKKNDNVNDTSTSCARSVDTGKDRLGKDRLNNTFVEKTSTYEQEFENLWKIYPKKEGKTEAKKKYLKYRKEGTTYEEILKGLENYNNYLKAKGTDRQYIKNGSTWFNQKCWEDEYVIENSDTNKSHVVQTGEGVFELR